MPTVNCKRPQKVIALSIILYKCNTFSENDHKRFFKRGMDGREILLYTEILKYDMHVVAIGNFQIFHEVYICENYN